MVLIITRFLCVAKNLRDRLFHFQAAWLSHPEYEPLVKDTWCEADGAIPVRLGRVKDKSIDFNKHVFGNIFQKKKKAT